MKTNNKQLGFTIIELMISVAIIGVIAAFAVPSYKDYVMRAKITTGIEYLNDYRKGVEEYYAAKGKFPETVTDITNAPGKVDYVEGVEVHDGGILYLKFESSILTYPNNLLFLKPTVNSTGAIEWVCANKLNGATSVANQYVPNSCNNNIVLSFTQGGTSFSAILPNSGASVAMVLNPVNGAFEAVGSFTSNPQAASNGRCSGTEISLSDGTYQANTSYGNTSNTNVSCASYPKSETRSIPKYIYQTTNSCAWDGQTRTVGSGSSAYTEYYHNCNCQLVSTTTSSENVVSTYVNGNSTGLCRASSGSSYSQMCSGGTWQSSSPSSITSNTCGSDYWSTTR
jgi:type IV pilus assembly protein PilA